MRLICLALLSFTLAPPPALGQGARSSGGSLSQAVDNAGSSGNAATMSLVDTLGEAVISAVSSLGGKIADGFLNSLDLSAPVTTVVIGAPVFFTVNGSTIITSATLISFTAQDQGFGVSRTLVAVDTAAFSAYAGPLTLAAPGGHVLHYYSVDALGHAEQAKDLALQVDDAPPATTLALSGGQSFSRFGQTYVTPDTLFILTAADALVGVRVSSYGIDGAALRTYTAPFSLSEGTHTIAYFSQDTLGNVEAANSRLYSVSAFKLNAISAGASRRNELSGAAAVGGNVAANGAVELSGRATVQGNVTAASIELDGRGKITGSRVIARNALNPAPFDLAAALSNAKASNRNAEVAAYLDKNGVFRVKRGTVALKEGNYLFAGIDLDGGAAVTAQGKVGVFVEGSVSLEGRSSLNADAGADAESLALFVGPRPKPAGDKEDGRGQPRVAIAGSSSLGALVYAPEAATTVSGTSVLGGHLFTGTFDLDGQAIVAAGHAVPAIPKRDDALYADAAFQLGQVYAFPNPAKRGANPTLHVETGLADSVDIRIYDVSGNLVKSVTLSDPPQATDDGSGRGAQFAYEWTWDVSGVGSGIYVYVATAHSGSNAVKATKKVAVLK